MSQKGWIDYNNENKDSTFKVSQVVQEIVKKKNVNLFGEFKPILYSLDEKFVPHQYGYDINDDYEERTLYVRFALSAMQTFQNTDESLALLSERVGDYFRELGDLHKALYFYENNINIRNKICEPFTNNGYVDDNIHKQGLIISYSKTADTHFVLGDLNKALILLEKQLELSMQLYKRWLSRMGDVETPATQRNKLNVALSFGDIGNVHYARGHFHEALNFYEQGHTLLEELYKVDFKWIEIEKVADEVRARLSANETPETILSEMHLAAKMKYTPLQDRSEHISVKHYLAVSYFNIAEVHSALNRRRKAFLLYNNSLVLLKELSNKFPKKSNIKLVLSNCYHGLGVTHSRAGKFQEALVLHEKDASLKKELCDDYPHNVWFKMALAKACLNIGETNEQTKNKKVAKQYYLLARKCILELTETAPDDFIFNSELQWLDQQLAKFEVKPSWPVTQLRRILKFLNCL